MEFLSNMSFLRQNVLFTSIFRKRTLFIVTLVIINRRYMIKSRDCIPWDIVMFYVCNEKIQLQSAVTVKISEIKILHVELNMENIWVHKQRRVQRQLARHPLLPRLNFLAVYFVCISYIIIDLFQSICIGI